MLEHEGKVELLRAVPLFGGCSERELQQIAAIADELSFREGIVLTKQGHPGREMFVLLEGTVDVVRDGTLVNRLGPGDFVGEGALMLSKPRNATITATSPIRALVITQSNFTHLLDEDPDIARSVQETLDARTPPEA